MTIDEAIAILGRDNKTPGHIPLDVVKEAQKLGIEALDREQECRADNPKREWVLLPGETED